MGNINREQEITQGEAALLLDRSENTIRYHQRNGDWPKPMTVGFVLDFVDGEVESAQDRRDRAYKLAASIWGEG